MKRDSVEDVVDRLINLPTGTRVQLFTPLLLHPGRSLADELNILLQKGFTRIRVVDEVKKIEELLEPESASYLNMLSETLGIVQLAPKKIIPPKRGKKVNHEEPELPVAPRKQDTLKILIDRFAVEADDDSNRNRIADSVQTAFFEGHGDCLAELIQEGVPSRLIEFNNRFELDGIQFEEPGVQLFSFNNPFGACRRCEGFGSVIGIDEDLVIPDKSLSVYEGAIVCWRGEKMKEWNDVLIKNAYKFDFPIHRPIYDLTEDERTLLWKGNKFFKGIEKFFQWVETQTYKIQYRVMLSRYRGRTTCPDCRGTRLRQDANYVKVGNKSITDIVLLPVSESSVFFQTLELSIHDTEVGRRILLEIRNRLKFLEDVGLGYLTLNRLSNTLSG
ncbi:MAG: excinuclease ABC subunit A, partial [Bacteroidota bacterium]